jgi:hypothetical protein
LAKTTRKLRRPGSARGARKKPAAKKKTVADAKKPAKREWPKGREALAKAVLAALRDCDASVTPTELAKKFGRAPSENVDTILDALADLGQARRLRGGRYSG